MSRVDHDERSITLTLLVAGPRAAGKSTLMRTLRQHIPEQRVLNYGGADGGPEPLLDWLAVDLGLVSGWRVRVDIYAVPPAANRDSTRRLLLADADGLWLVADSQASRFDDNNAAFRAVREQLVDRDGRRRDLPTVYTWSKQDLPEELILAADVMHDGLNPGAAPAYAADLVHGTGVLEALHALVTLAMRRLAPSPQVVA